MGFMYFISSYLLRSRIIFFSHLFVPSRQTLTNIRKKEISTWNLNAFKIIIQVYLLLTMSPRYVDALFKVFYIPNFFPAALVCRKLCENRQYCRKTCQSIIKYAINIKKTIQAIVHSS